MLGSGTAVDGVPLTARPAPAWVDAVLAAVAAGLAVLALLAADLPALDPRLHATTLPAVLLTGVGALGIGLRRRAPLAGLLLVASVASAVSLAGYYTGLLPYLTLIALYAVAAHGGRRQALAGLAVVVGCFLGLVALGVPDLTPGDLATSVAVGVAAAAIGDAVRLRRAHQREMVATAESRAEAAAAEAARAVADAARAGAEADRAVAEERLRIARELHDAVAHSMSLIAVQAGVGGHLLHDDPAAAGRALDVIADTSREALAQARAVIGLLRSGEDTQPSVPGLAALDQLVQGVRDAGLPVSLSLDGPVRDVPVAVDLAAYRIVQESLTNAVRHAPGLPVSVRLARTADRLRVEVENGAGTAGAGTAGAGTAGAGTAGAGTAGPPSDPAPGRAAGGDRHGFGLLGLRERAAAVGGRLHAGPTPAGGFRVSATLPAAPGGGDAP